MENSSFRRKPESSRYGNYWTPAFAGVTLCISFLIWLTMYHSRLDALHAEQNRAMMLAKTVAAINLHALESRLDFLIQLDVVLASKGVRKVFVVDDQGKVLAPVSDFGASFQRMKKTPGWLLAKTSIASLGGEKFGEAVVLLEPHIPHFYLLWGAFFLPLLFLSGFFLWQVLPRHKNVEPVKEAESFEWLSLMGKMMQKKIYCFDGSGHLLASSNGNAYRHILDLFPDATTAQHILSSPSGERENPPSLEGRGLASGPGGGEGVVQHWEHKNGQRRFIIALP